MQSIRPEDSQFNQIEDFPYQEHYVDFEDLRVHYIDEGEGEVILALHGEPSWSYLYRKFVPTLSSKYRFIAPDLIGFGKSDKLTSIKDYSFSFHFRSLENLVNKLQLKDITLVVQDWGGLLGLSLLGEHPDWFKRVVVMNTALPSGKPLPFAFKLWVAYARYHPIFRISNVINFGTYNKLTPEVRAAYDAPFPSQKHKSGARAFPVMVPQSPDTDGVKQMKKAREVLSQWDKPALVMFSDKDKMMSHMIDFFFKMIPTAKENSKVIIKNASHFLQEDKGEEIAAHIDQFMSKG